MKKTIYIMLILMMLAMPLEIFANPNESGGGTSVEVPYGPTFWIDKVMPKDYVQIRVKNHPKGERYTVYMKSNDNPNTGWLKVGLLDGYHQEYEQEFDIPSIIKYEAQLSIMVLSNVGGENATSTFSHASNFKSLGTSYSIYRPNLSATGGHSSVELIDGLKFWIHDIEHPYNITISYSYFSKKDNFQLWLTDPDNDGAEWKNVGNIKVGQNPASGKVTFTIPSVFRSSQNLTLKVMNSLTHEYAWIKFQNRDNWRAIGVYSTKDGEYHSSTASAYSSYSSTGSYSGPVPFTIVTNVVANDSVTMNVYNFKINDELLVTIGLSGTYGIGGISVGLQDTGETGNFSATYIIPPELYGQGTLSIRLESTSSSFYAFDWFNNDSSFSITDTTSTTTTTDTTSIPATSIPTSNVIVTPGLYPSFTVTSITPNSQIQIAPANFTGNDTYVVTMGPFGSYGVNGYVSTTITTDASGTLSTTTFPIPTDVHAYDTIHVRLESPLSGYYSYNYFTNK